MDPKLDSNLVFLRRLLKFSMLVFRDHDKNAKISKWRLILVFVIMSIATICLFSIFYYVIKCRNELSLTVFETVSLAFQAFVSFCLIIRWQFGPFDLIFDSNTWNQFGYPIFSNPRMKKRLIIFYLIFGFFSMNSLYLSLHGTFSYYSDIKNGTSPRKNREIFGIEGSAGIGYAFIVYSHFTFLIVFLFHVIVLSSVSEIFRFFNRELRQFGERSDKLDDLIEALSKLHEKQVKMIVLLRKINSTFEIFCCLSMGPTIIILISSLYKLCRAVMIGNLTEISGDAFYFSTYLLMLIGLTEPASRIHSEAKAMAINTLLNMKIWASRNHDLRQIASMIVTNAKEELGVSIWGFAIISKSMLLTIASLSATYVVVACQMDPVMKTTAVE